MKYIPETISEIQKVALSMMVFSTCGEDEKTLAETVVEQIGPDIYHITYALDDPFDAMDFQVAVDQKRDTVGCTSYFHYTIFRSKTADNGDFSLAIK